MQFDIKKQAVPCLEMLLNTTLEQSLECDILLPDYCPDIVKVLSCRMESGAYDCIINGKSLTIDTMAIINLYYLGGNGCIKKTQYKLPVSKTVELPADARNPITCICCDVGFLNCRAVSSRRFDIRGSMMISIKVYSTANKEILSPIIEKPLYFKKCCLDAITPVGQIARQFSMREELSIFPGNTAPVEILFCSVTPRIDECHLSLNSAMVKGEMAVHVLYSTGGEPCGVNTCDYLLPFSQMTDLPGANATCDCNAIVRCMSSAIVINDEDNDGKMLLEAQFVTDFKLFEGIEINAVCDVFSPLSPVHVDKIALNLIDDVSSLSIPYLAKAKCPIPTDMTAISDCTVSLSCPVIKRDDSPLVTFKVLFSLLYSDAVSGYGSLECVSEVTVPVVRDVPFDSLNVLANLTSGMPSAVISNGELLFECPVTVEGLCIVTNSVKAVSNVEIGEPYKERKKSQSLIIYYPFEGEDIWDIGKRYMVSPDMIKEENDMDGDTIMVRTPIIIPNL